MPVKLKIDWCSHKAAVYAVLNWHYSGKAPCGKLVKFGVWEDDKFVGAVIYGSGATPHIGSPYNCKHGEACELVRVAMTNHETPTSKVVGITLRLMRKHFPNIRVIVSYADTAQGHVGVIYQAGGWMYTGSAAYHAFRLHGELIHPRTVGITYGTKEHGGQSIEWLRNNVDPNAEKVITGVKHKYIKVFDDSILPLIKPLPYPKKETVAA